MEGEGGRAPRLGALLTLALALLTSPALASDIHSNGAGGGLWSDPATWHGGTVPGPADVVVVSRGDTVVVDRDDDGKASCAELAIDPGGELTFKAGMGRATLSVAGPIDAYGIIRIDSTADASDVMELRLVAETAEARVLRLQQGAALLVSGREGMGEQRNAVLASKSLPKPVPEPEPAAEPAAEGAPPEAAAPAEPPPPTPELPAILDALDGSTLDLKSAGLADVVIRATGIDNTGAEPTERLNVVRCRFTGLARITLSGCDTPMVAHNVFTDAANYGLGPTGFTSAAIHLYGCPLAEIRGNAIQAAIDPEHRNTYGIMGYVQTDSIIADNVIEGASQGVYWHGNNAMFSGNMIRNCDTGLFFTSMSGSLENTLIEGCKVGVGVGGATVQFTTLRIEGVPEAEGAVAMDLASGAVTLVNCNLAPAQIKLGATPPKDKPWVDAMSYLVVGVKGQVPPRSVVEVKTAGWTPPAPGAADLNVRNSPARVSNGLTPLPQSLQPLLVRAWTIGADGQPTAAPTYTISVLGPPPEVPEPPPAPEAPSAEGAPAAEPPPPLPRPVLATVNAQPDATWYREEPNARTPTVEVTVP